LWLGPEALDANRNINNAVVSIPGTHPPVAGSGIFRMIQDQYYALTIEFGNSSMGNGVLTFSYNLPNSSEAITDLTGQLFYNSATNGH